MRTALMGMALLYGAALFMVTWLYGTDEATLSVDQRSFGSVMLGLAGTLMLIGVAVVPRTPALASVPFGLAGTLTFVAHTSGHGYLYVYGGWALALAALSVVIPKWERRRAARVSRRPVWDVEEAPVGDGVDIVLASHYLRQVERYRARDRKPTVPPETLRGYRESREAPRVAAADPPHASG
jgi:hypothetical protein